MRILRRVHDDQGGASLVIVAVSLLMLLGAGAIAADAGSMWQTKRNLIADTDSAALAAARNAGACSASGAWIELASGHPSYEAAVDLLERNLGDAPDTSRLTVEHWCDVGVRGKVRVSYAEEAILVFSGALGYDTLTVDAASTAQTQPLGGGLRPFAVCIHDTQIDDWLDGGEGSTITLAWDHSMHGGGGGGGGGALGACGGIPGNWGLLCFDREWDPRSGGSDCNARDVQTLIDEGYPWDVDLGLPAPGDEDCRIDTPNDDGPMDWCQSRTGLGGSLDVDGLLCPTATHRDSCEHQFAILGIDGWNDEGGGNAELHPALFIGVVLRHPSSLQGSEPACETDAHTPVPGGTRRCLSFEITSIFSSGTLQNSDVFERNGRMCGVDRDPSGGDRCDF